MEDGNIDARQALSQKLVEQGEKDRLRDMLKRRLSECGWRDQLKEYARNVVNERNPQQVTVDELVKDITPKARELVPDSVKRELLAEIKAFLESKNY